MHSDYSSIEERRKSILAELSLYNKVYVKSLADKFGVSSETIRRDLDSLEKEQKLKKVFGGAVKSSTTSFLEWNYSERENVCIKEKQRIGLEAARIVNDHDVIALQAGSTTIQMLQHLVSKKGLVIVSNSLPILLELMQYKKNGQFDGKAIALGGELSLSSLQMSGLLAEESVKRLFVNKAFLSCAGLTCTSISTFHHENAQVSRLFMERSEQSILLADSSKLNKQDLYEVCGLDEIHGVVCDADMPEEWKESGLLDQIFWNKA